MSNVDLVHVLYFCNMQNVSHGPYLCPKHTKCHSCGSSVPGNGLSVRYESLVLIWNFSFPICSMICLFFGNCCYNFINYFLWTIELSTY